jgi:glycosyltransferase involved in cell wall biosynthesis
MMKKLVDRKIKGKKYDLILVHLIRMAEYVKDYPIRKILDMTDAQSLNYLRSRVYNAGFWSLVTNAENIMVKKYERKIWKYFDKTVVVSPVDQAYLKKIDERMNVDVVPIGVDIEKYKYRLNNHNKPRLCLIGNMRTAPNTDAAAWFSRKILPLIKKEIPDIELYIVGSEPSPRVRELSKIPNIFITGKVDDISQYVHDAAVSVAPMRVGAGMQFKILESMALGTPVVATSIGMGGIECAPDEELLIGDTPADFARQVIKLIKNPRLRAEISKNAHQFILKNYTWEKVLLKLDE